MSETLAATFNTQTALKAADLKHRKTKYLQAEYLKNCVAMQAKPHVGNGRKHLA